MQNFNLQNKKDIKGIKQQVKLQDQSQANCKKMLQLFTKKITTASYTSELQLIILQQKIKLGLFICNKEIMAKEMKSKLKKISKNTINSIKTNKINIMKITIMVIELKDNNLMKL
jgi:hypothetical protein